MEYLIEKGEKYYSNEDFDAADKTFTKAIILAEKQSNKPAHLQALVWKSECAFQHQAFEVFQQLSYEAKQFADDNAIQDSLYFTILQNIGVSHSYLGRFDLQRQFYKSAKNFVESNFPNNTKMLADAYYNVAAAYYRSFSLDSAIVWFDSTLTLTQKSHYTSLEAKVYLNRGVLFSRRNDFNQAIQQQIKALQLTQNTNEKILGQTHLANYYNVIEEKENAFKHLNIALKLVRSERLHQQYHAMVELNACKLFLQYQNKASFLKTWNNLNTWLPENDINFQGDRKKTLNLLAQYQIETEQYQLAESTIKKALINTDSRQYPETKNWSLMLYAQLLQKQGKHQLSLQKIQQALHIITPAFEQKKKDSSWYNIAKNPKPDEILAFEQSLELLSQKMAILLDWYHHDKNNTHLSQALKVYECVDSFLILNRRQLKHKESKSTLSALVQPFFKTSGNLFYALYESSKNPKWIEQAFNVMEKSRALIISENLLKQSALAANIPEELRLKEQQLAQKANYLNFLIKQSQNVSQTENKRTEWQNELFSVEQQWAALLKKLALNNKNYYALNYQLAVSTIQNTQQNLIKDNEIVLAFMDLSDELLLIGISQSAIFFKKLPLHISLKEQIIALRNSLEERSRAFYAQSHLLYNEILKPISNEIKNKDLIIIPDGWLWKLPFSALVTERSTDGSANYLVEQNNIRFWHSAHSSTLLQQQSTHSYTYNCTAFAPFCYEGYPGKNLSPLPGSLKEANALQKVFPRSTFNLYLDEKATVSNFLESIQSSQIIHVSSHTKIDNYYPGLSCLYFHHHPKDRDKDNKVYVYDLYQKPMQAELAVLNTCRSGDDKVKKGEGLAGLTQAFAMAGCPNIIVSQWPLNDQSSAQIMIDFYKNLQNKQAINDALTNAQRAYLSTCDPLEKHPYYWAAFIQIGENDLINFDKVQTPSRRGFYVKIVLFLIMIAALFFFIFFQKKK